MSRVGRKRRASLRRRAPLVAIIAATLANACADRHVEGVEKSDSAVGASSGGATPCKPAMDSSALVVPGGHARMQGCHETRQVADRSCVSPASGIKTCNDDTRVLSASELPCGSCTASDVCHTLVKPLCDCDGDGPLAPFTDTRNGSSIVEGWICQCEEGSWQCYLRDQAGPSCSASCTHADGGVPSTAPSPDPDAGLSCDALLQSILAMRSTAFKQAGLSCATADDCLFGPNTTCAIGCQNALVSWEDVPSVVAALNRVDVFCDELVARGCDDPYSAVSCTRSTPGVACVEGKCTLQ